ncbi:Transmembrane and TPR repeat-containing protein 4, partial [Ophiophagus hannah]
MEISCWQKEVYRMAQGEVNLDHDIPLLTLPPYWAKTIVGLFSIICFVNSYDGDFVFDDSEAIINNKDLRADTPLGDLWHHDFWGNKLNSNTSHKSYRPLTVLTFRINYLLAGGFHPLGFHIINIILHCIISVLIVDVFSILLGGLHYTNKGRRLNFVPKSSFLAALLFAVHPVHTECGSLAEQTSCVPCSFCYLFLATARRLKRGLNALFDAVMINRLNILEVVLKILHKDKSVESLVVFRKGLLFRITLLLSGGATVLYARWQIMGTGPPAFTEVDNPASFASSPFVRAVNYNYYYSLNAWLLLCPWWLCFDWSMGCVPLIKSVRDWRIIALVLLWLCLIVLACQALGSKDGQKRRILTLGLGFLIIPFLPASNLFFRVGFVVAERVTYLPSIGYCILITYGFCLLCKQVKNKKLLVAAMLGLLLINVWRCVIRSNQWRSEEQLFRSALSVCPLNAKVHYNVGKNLADNGNQSAAISYYREAVRLNPKYVHAMNNLGNILKEKNELHEAEELLSLAVQIQPDFAAAWMNLGIYADLNRHIDALNAWRNATVLKPQHSLAWNNMIILLDNTGNLAQAETVGREALELIPNDHSLMFSLANVLGKSQKYKESEALFHKAIKANPTAASYHAVLYHRWGNFDLAKKHYEVSLKLDPTAAGTRENYSLLKKKLDQLQNKG